MHENAVKKNIKRLIRHFGFEVRRIDMSTSTPFEDIRRLTPRQHPMIFDVGANVGQTVKELRKYFTNPEIHSFEPSPSTFQQLTETAGRLPHVHLVNSALGANVERKTFVENERSDMSSFFEPGPDAWGSIKQRTELMIDTIDDYCDRYRIGQIDILKSDTQGYDLQVLKGASNMLASQKVKLVYLELIFSNMYEGLPRFDETFAFLADHGFSLVKFYSMHYQHDLLSWTDALFISRQHRDDTVTAGWR